MPRRRLPEDWEMRFLAELTLHHNQEAAAGEAGVDIRTVLRHKAKRPGFRAAVEAVLQCRPRDGQIKKDPPQVAPWFSLLQSAKGRLGARKRWGGTLQERHPVAGGPPRPARLDALIEEAIEPARRVRTEGEALEGPEASVRKPGR